MPTSTVIQYGLQAVQYSWDTVFGFMSVGGFTFYAVLAIVVGVICLAIAFLKGIFRIN